jgi:hypothetical protein
MSVWAGPVILAVVFLAVWLIPRVAPPSWVAFLFSRPGVRPTGPHGTLRKRDILRYAAAAGIISTLLLLASLAAYSLSDHWPVTSSRSQIAAVYGFTMFLLAAVGYLLALITLWYAIRWKPPRDNPGGPSDQQGDAQSQL